MRDALIRLLDRHHLQIKKTAGSITVGQLPAAPAEQEPWAADPPAVQPSDAPAAAQPQAGQLSRSRRLERYTQVVDLQRHGLSMRQIAEKIGLHRSTVRKFVNAGQFPERASRQYARRTDRFADYLRQRWDQGCHNAAQLARELVDQGFKGSRYAVRRYVAGWREPNRPDRAVPARHSVIERPSSNRVSWLLLGYPAERSAEEEAFVKALQQECPLIAAATKLAQEFSQMIHDRNGDLLDDWITKAEEPTAPRELLAFAAGLKRDYAAVKAALTVEWSNGQVEGQINRLKFIKRQMYGRAKFDLLRQRVLNTG
jgi:transposase